MGRAREGVFLRAKMSFEQRRFAPVLLFDRKPADAARGGASAQN